MNKKTFFTLIFLTFFIIFTSCDNSSLPAELPDFIPQVAFGSITSRVIVDASDSDNVIEAQYMLLGPLLSSFKGNNDFKSGNQYAMPIFDSNMVFDIIPQSGGSIFYFQGTMEDGSGWINVYYDQSAKTFSFDQCIYIDVPLMFTEFIVYADGQDITLDNDGYFHNWYDIAYISYMDDGAGPEDPGWELSSMTAEIYRGEMNAVGNIGTGFGYFSDDDADYTLGTRFYSANNADISTIGLTGIYPATISIDNISSWKDVLSSLEVKQLDSDNSGPDGGFWEIFYKMDSGSIPVRLSDDTDSILDNLISGYKTGFTPDLVDPIDPDRADLSTWGNSSLVFDAMQ